MDTISEDAIWLTVSLLVLAFFAGQWLRRHLLRRHARNWPTAIGTVEATDLRQERRGNMQSVHVAEVLYSYEAMGNTCSGRWRRNTLLYGRAKKWLDGNPPGHMLWVRYNPDNAKMSIILERDQAMPQNL